MTSENPDLKYILTVLQGLGTKVDQVLENVDPEKKEKSKDLKEENFPDNWEKPAVLIPDETTIPLQGENDDRDNDKGDPKVFHVKGVGQAGRD